MSDTNGWPDVTQPGVPMNPDVDGWHWVELAQTQPPAPYFWNAEYQDWKGRDWMWMEAEHLCIYCGPCLTPSEAQQRERAAAAAVWMAAREAGAEAARCVLIPEDASASEAHGRISAALEACMRIRALPPPEDATAALAEVVAKARREGMEEAAVEADRVAERAHTALQEPGLIDAIRRDFLHQRNGARDAAAAIRARSEGGGA